MTALELIQQIQKPGKRFAINRDGDEPGTAIAVWHDEQWVMIAGRLVTGDWAHMPGLCVNGKPVHSDWLEVKP